jgi:PKD repeat protein
MCSPLTLFTFFFALTLTACAEHAVSPAEPELERNAFVARQLSALDQLPAPQGVDTVTWLQLKAGLRTALTARSSALAPAADRSQSLLSYDDDSATFRLTYYSQGDYNQDGLVSINDLTPLGVHFGKAVVGAPNSAMAVTDGNGDGLISIADLTPIGANFGRTVRSFKVYEGEAPAPPAPGEPSGSIPVATVEFSTKQGIASQERIWFEFTADTLQGNYYWARPVDGGHEGIATNAVGIGVLALQVINKPSGGGLEDNPYLAVFGGQYALQVVDGDGNDITTDPLTSFELSDPLAGTIDDGLLRIDDLYRGQFSVAASYDGDPVYPTAVYFSVVGEGPNRAPVADLEATLTDFEAPAEAQFDAGDSYDPNEDALTFEWDWDGDGVYDFDGAATSTAAHTYDQPGSYTVGLRVTDPEGLSDTDSTTVYIGSPPDSDPPTPVLNITPLTGPAPLTVEMDGFASTDTEGGISYYLFDVGGPLDPAGNIIYEYGGLLEPVQHTFARPGTYTVRMLIYDDEDQNATITQEVVVTEPAPDSDPPTGTLTANPGSGPAPLEVHLIGAGADTSGYVRSFGYDVDGDGDIDFTTEDQYQYGVIVTLNTPGTYNFALQLTDDEGDSVTVFREVTVTPGEGS